MTHPLYVATQDSTGTVYPSIRACARAHSRHRRTVAYHLDTHGDLSRLGMGMARPNCQNAAKPVTIGKHSWPSRVAAARDLRVTESQIKRWIKPNASPACRDLLMAALMRWQARKSEDPRIAVILDMRAQGMSKTAIATKLRMGSETVKRLMEAAA